MSSFLRQLLRSLRRLSRIGPTSVTRMEYNPEGLAEITVRTFADDLEAILRKRTGKSVRVDGSKAADTLMLGYMQSVFVLKSGVQEVELQWIGIELKGNTAWIYLQAKLPRGRWKTSLRNTFLFDLFEDQVNIVNVFAKAKKASLVFKRGDAAQEIPNHFP